MPHFPKSRGHHRSLRCTKGVCRSSCRPRPEPPREEQESIWDPFAHLFAGLVHEWVGESAHRVPESKAALPVALVAEASETESDAAVQLQRDGMEQQLAEVTRRLTTLKADWELQNEYASTSSPLSTSFDGLPSSASQSGCPSHLASPSQSNREPMPFPEGC